MCRKLVYLASLALVLSMVLTSAVRAADPSLVGWWRLDDSSGTTAIDSSGNGNDGALMGDPQWAVGKIGGALQFDGTDDYVEVPHAEILTVDSEVTVMAWINASQHEVPGAGYQGIIAKGNGPRSYSLYTTAAGVMHFSTGPGGGYTGSTSSAQVPLNEWVHVCAQVINGGHQYYLNGEDAGSGGNGATLQGTQDTGTVLIGRTQEGANRSFGGLIDDARVYNRGLSQEEIQSAMIGQGLPLAFAPNPEDGAPLEATWVTLSWKPGDFAVSHDVYMGEIFDDVNDGTSDTFKGNQASTMFIAGFAGFPFPDGLVAGTTYYWRIDEVNDANVASPWKGEVWSFWVPPKKAYSASPSDGAEFINADVTLSWTGGFGAKLHTVYFGDDFDTVNSATGGTQQASTTLVPGTLEMDKTYYWRVDEFDPPAIHKGDVWSFSTIPDIAITDPDLMGWWKLDEGEGSTAVDWSGHGHHGTFEGEPQWAAGIDGGALEFDGASYVDTGYTEDLATYTIACWAKSPDAPSGASPSGPLHREQNYQFNWTHGNEIFRGSAAMNAGGAWQAASLNPLEADRWYHLAATYDGTAFKAYRDGVLITSTPVSGPPNAESNSAKLGRHAAAAQFFTGTVDDARVYNRALTAEEILKVMRGDPFVAWNASPTNGSTPNAKDVVPLGWSAGDNATQHDVYFGADVDAVDNADTSDTTGVYRGRQNATSYTPTEPIAWGDGLYYWRIDEINADGTISVGRIWSFTVADFLLVDDFESYNNIDPPGDGSNRIFDVWIDGFGTTTNGALVGNDLPPYAERTVVHGGAQSLVYRYDNNLKTSEATLTLVDPRNWTEEGVTKLSLWFIGDPANTAERVSVALNGTAVVYHDDQNAVLTGTWTEWVIDLQAFADQGVNLANVNTITIGFGTKNSPVAGGAGTMYFDDIQLIR